MLSGNIKKVKVYILSRKCSGVKVKVDINLNSEVKYRYVKFLLKYSNEVFVLRYITTLLMSKTLPTNGSVLDILFRNYRHGLFGLSFLPKTIQPLTVFKQRTF